MFREEIPYTECSSTTGTWTVAVQILFKNHTLEKAWVLMDTMQGVHDKNYSILQVSLVSRLGNEANFNCSHALQVSTVSMRYY